MYSYVFMKPKNLLSSYYGIETSSYQVATHNYHTFYKRYTNKMTLLLITTKLNNLGHHELTQPHNATA